MAGVNRLGYLFANTQKIVGDYQRKSRNDLIFHQITLFKATIVIQTTCLLPPAYLSSPGKRRSVGARRRNSPALGADLNMLNDFSFPYYFSTSFQSCIYVEIPRLISPTFPNAVLWYGECVEKELSWRERRGKISRVVTSGLPGRSGGVKASLEWLATSRAEFSAGAGRSGCAHLKHYSAAYREWGEGPPLVVIPGLAGGFELLGPLARILAGRFRVISYQLRGEDDCFALRRRFGLSDLAADLAEFLDWHGLERPTLLGVSFGGVIGLEFAARYPGRLRALAVQGAGARFETGLLQRVAGTVLSGYPLPPDNPFINQFFNLLFGGRQKPGPLFQFVTQQCWQTDQSVMAHRFRLAEQFNLAGRLDRIRVPTLALTGDRDLLVSDRSLRELAEGLPHVRLVRLDGCGHLAFITRPQHVADEFNRFLRERV